MVTCWHQHPVGNPLWNGGTVGQSRLTGPFVIVVGIGMWMWWPVGKKCRGEWTRAHTLNGSGQTFVI